MREFDQAVPEQVAELKDWLADTLAEQQGQRWAKRVLRCAPVNGEYDLLAGRLAVRRLREECLPLADIWPEELCDDVTAAIQTSIMSLEGNGSRSEAVQLTRAVKEAASRSPTSPEFRAAHSAVSAASVDSAALAAAVYASAARAQAHLARCWPGAPARSPLASRSSSAWLSADEARADAIRREAERFIDELKNLPVR